MCPLIVAPSRGYPDWQRIVNWDGGSLVSAVTPGDAGAHTFGPFDVSRFASIAGSWFESQSQCIVTLMWSDTQGGPATYGQRQFTLSSLISRGAQFCIRNQGPWLTIQTAPLGGAAYTAHVNAFGSNRSGPLEFVPVNVPLINQHGVNIAANSNLNFYPLDFYSGPVTLEVFTTIAGVQFEIDTLQTDNTWIGCTVIAPAANVWTIQTVAVPGGTWRAAAFTGAAAGPVWIFIVPSSTGSI